MSWTKFPAIKGTTACLTCGCGAHDTLALNRVIAVGFGSAQASKDGVCFYNEPHADAPDEAYMSAQQVEDLAIKDPDHDWRIQFNAPLYEAEYQRQGDGHWVLISKGDGFA
jgi:hypothetical protein